MDERVAVIILNTALAAASGIVFSLAVGWPLYKMPDVSLALNGALAGLVAITAPCAFVTELDSVIIGGIGGVVMVGGTFLMERMRIDDAVGAVPVHMVAGVWGTLAVAFFGDAELVGTGLGLRQQLGVQALGVAAAGVWAFGVSYIILSTMNRIRPLRVSAENERLGLNVSEHGASTEIFDLVSAMEDQERTGDLSKRVPVEPFTEVGQIAAQYNAVLSSLDENLIAKSEYLSILDNVSDGLFLIDKEFRISPYYSASTESIFEEQDLAGKKLTNIISFRDDGKGIDLKLLKERARESGRYSDEKLASLSGTDAMKLMFDVGISAAADEPNEHAGRGVGMDIVRRTVRQIGGDLKVLFRSGSYCEFRFSIPT
ncbi:MAG: hypothetical protein GVY23_07945 [Spirochaetes bacterium]|jgi:Amt family ammonium transporter|nr:hypothetical protein [Spirochaetota bacterium]